MPPKSKRVGSKDFKEIFESGRFFNGEYVKFLYKKEESGALKYSVAVPKKIEKKAVKRNIIKRRVREILKNSNNFQKINSLKIVVLVKDKSKGQKFADLKSGIEKDISRFLSEKSA